MSEDYCSECFDKPVDYQCFSCECHAISKGISPNEYQKLLKREEETIESIVDGLAKNLGIIFKKEK
jgi:hypothetical protein